MFRCSGDLYHSWLNVAQSLCCLSPMRQVRSYCQVLISHLLWQTSPQIERPLREVFLRNRSWVVTRLIIRHADEEVVTLNLRYLLDVNWQDASARPYFAWKFQALTSAPMNVSLSSQDKVPRSVSCANSPTSKYHGLISQPNEYRPLH